MFGDSEIPPPPTAEMLRALDTLLAERDYQMCAYIGSAHIEIAELLYKHMPHRYYLMDNCGRHRKLFRWQPDEHDYFYLVPVQPPRPDCLKVPFSDEGMPQHDLLIKDIPWYPGQFQAMINTPSYGPAATVVLLHGATNVERLDLYDWSESENMLIGRCKTTRELNPERLQSALEFARSILKYFPS